MANQEQVAILKAGVAKWNEWVSAECKSLQPAERLRYLDLSEADLREIDLRGANLVWVNFMKANLGRAMLSKANLEGAMLSEAHLERANLRGANLDGADLSSSWLFQANLKTAKLTNASMWHANLSGAVLDGANLNGANLTKANLSGACFCPFILLKSQRGPYGIRIVISPVRFVERLATLKGADLSNAYLWKAVFRRANLSGADLTDANLQDVDFDGCDLIGANLSGANISAAGFHQCNLSDAHLEHAVALKTDFSGANLTSCHIYGISAWDVNVKGAIQSKLIITESEPHIRVDDLEVAQFIYLLLKRRKLRDVITILGNTAVLILGRFSERKQLLDRIAEKMRSLGFLPIIFDFERPTDRDLTETIKVLAGLSRFVIADITNPRSVPLELQATIPDYMVPFVTILERGQPVFSMFDDLAGKYHWALPPLEYRTADTLMAAFEQRVVAPAIEKCEDIRDRKAFPPRRRSAED